MSDTHQHDAASEAAHAKQYVKVWLILLVLLAISITGPFIGIKIVTLITAFGIAFVKAYLVATRFMHVDAERPVIWYAVGGGLLVMLVFFAAVSPDVMKHEGRRWENVAAKAEVDRQMALHEAGGDAHGPDAGGEHAPAEHTPGGEPPAEH